MSEFRLEIVTPHSSRVIDNVKGIISEGEQGHFMVMQSHEPYLFLLKDGIVKVIFMNEAVEDFKVEGASLLIEKDRYTLVAELIV